MGCVELSTRVVIVVASALSAFALTVHALASATFPPFSSERHEIPGVKIHISSPSGQTSEMNVVRGRWTLPRNDSARKEDALPETPVVVLYNGFTGRLTFYEAYADALAACGMAVLQWDVDCAKLTHAPCPDVTPVLSKVQVRAFQDVMAWAEAALPSGTVSLLRGNRVAVGHSVGGDAAYGQLLDPATNTTAAVLIDPVVQGRARAPRRSSKPLLVVGGKPSICNANGSYMHFLQNAHMHQTGLDIPLAGHLQFWRMPQTWQWVADHVCDMFGPELHDATVLDWAVRLTVGSLLQLPDSVVPLPMAQDMRDVESSRYLEWLAERISTHDFQDVAGLSNTSRAPPEVSQFLA